MHFFFFLYKFIVTTKFFNNRKFYKRIL